jgi:hypothetical protein
MNEILEPCLYDWLTDWHLHLKTSWWKNRSTADSLLRNSIVVWMDYIMGCYILRVGILFFGVCVKAMVQWVCRTERGMARRMLGWEKCARSLSESRQQTCTSPLRCIPCWESRLNHTKLLLDLKLLHSCDIQAKDAGKLQTLCFVEDLSISWDSQKNRETKKKQRKPDVDLWPWFGSTAYNLFHVQTCWGICIWTPSWLVAWLVHTLFTSWVATIAVSTTLQ